MAKLTVSIFLAAVLCCALQAEGAGLTDFLTVIVSTGNQVREELLRRFQEGTASLVTVQLTPVQLACATRVRDTGLTAISTALLTAQNTLSGNTVSWVLRLPLMSIEQLALEIRDTLLRIANPVVDRLIADTLACI